MSYIKTNLVDLSVVNNPAPGSYILGINTSTEKLSIKDSNGDIYLIGNESDKNFVHFQETASQTWNIEHSLNKKCTVNITDSDGNSVIAAIKWIDDDNVQINFNMPFIGYAYFN
jgi:hypothetical protein